MKPANGVVLNIDADFKDIKLNIKSKRHNEEEQAKTQIQHYFYVYLLWLSIDS